jgi:hypothetical protein
MDGSRDSPRKRGRKPGSSVQPLSTAERLQRKLQSLEKAKKEARELERNAKQRIVAIVGRVIVDAADAEPEVLQWLQARLRAAKLSARDKAEIAAILLMPNEARP